jgi:hypothetical protein
VPGSFPPQLVSVPRLRALTTRPVPARAAAGNLVAIAHTL